MVYLKTIRRETKQTNRKPEANIKTKTGQIRISGKTKLSKVRKSNLQIKGFIDFVQE